MVAIVAMSFLGISTRSAVGEDRRAPEPANAPAPAKTKAPAKRGAAKRLPDGPAASAGRPCFEVDTGTREARCLPTLAGACRAAGCAIGEPAIHPCGVTTAQGRLVVPPSPETEGHRGGRVMCFGW